MKQNKPTVSIWNCADGDNGDFKYECEQIEGIKRKLSGIEDRRTKDGTEEIKSNLDTALKEYEDGQSSPNKKEAPKPRGDG